MDISMDISMDIHIHGKPDIIFVVDSVCTFVCLSVSPSVTLLLQIASSFLFVDEIEPFFGCQFSMWHSTTKLFS